MYYSLNIKNTMKKVLSTLSLLFLSLSVIAQDQCDCEILIHDAYFGQVYIYDQPNGEIIDSIRHDIGNEDYLLGHITAKKEDYFKVTLALEMSGVEKSGWIQKSSYIGIYARNYGENGKLNLYTSPDKNSAVESTVNEFIYKLYTIEDCQEDWLKVQLDYERKTYTGWMEKDMQCANPYSTCN